MERKTKHRILGILVAVGLVIILLPLFQSEKESPTEQAQVQAPPFPDQPIQTLAAQEPEQSQMQPPQDPGAAQPTSPPIINPSQDNGVNQQPDDTVSSDSATQNPSPENATPTPIASEKPIPDSQLQKPEIGSSETSTVISNDSLENKAKEAAEKVLMTSAAPTEDKLVTKPVHHVKSAKKSAHQSPIVAEKKHSLTKSPLEEDGLFKLKNSAWVIQMGSFKNKDNAVKLANKLRNKGYPAFIQQIASSTRVFVGPSTKQTTARTLASKIKSDIQMEGIVISYKPLAL